MCFTTSAILNMYELLRKWIYFSRVLPATAARAYNAITVIGVGCSAALCNDDDDDVVGPECVQGQNIS